MTKSNGIVLHLLFLCLGASAQQYTFTFGRSGDCDSIPFFLCESRPKPNLSGEQLDYYLNTSIDVDSYNVKNGDTIVVLQTIDTNGIGCYYHTINLQDSSFCFELAKNIDTYLRWIPAMQRGRKVDFNVNMLFEIRNGMITTLSLLTNYDNVTISKHKRRKKRRFNAP